MSDLKPANLQVDEKRAITTHQLRAMRTRAHRLIDQLTAVSGYGQIAIGLQPKASVLNELEKIVSSMQEAVKSVRNCIDAVDEIERTRMPG